MIHLIKEQYETLESIEKYTLSAEELSKFEVENIPLEAILFQTGYLTINSYDKKENLYTLTYPNREVSQSFHQLIIASMVDTTYNKTGFIARELTKALKDNNLELFFKHLKTLFAHVTYFQREQNESYYHAIFQFLGTLLGFNLQSEVLTDKGRIDLVLATQTHIYIFEIKHNSTPEIALAQIEDKKYYERYLLSQKDIVLVGLSCNDNKGLKLLD